MDLLIKQVDDATSIINQSLKTLNGVSSKKINFQNSMIDESFYLNENLYAVVFDIDKSSILDGNDPMKTLSLLEDKVLGIYSCMEDEDSISVISGTEDESGLILRTYIVAYIYARYEDIKASLNNFIDELKFLPLDIETLLGVSIGSRCEQVGVLKKLADTVKDLNLDLMSEEVDIVMESIEVDTLAYLQLQRFLDIAGLIDENDTSKLTNFFTNLYKGEVYVKINKPEINQELIESLTNIFNELIDSRNSLINLADSVTDMTPNTLKKEITEKYTDINSISKELEDLIKGNS